MRKLWIQLLDGKTNGCILQGWLDELKYTDLEQLKKAIKAEFKRRKND